MPDLPDGTTVTLQHSEGWDVNYTGGTTLIWSEGWEVELLAVSTITCSAFPTEAKVGEATTLSGKCVDEDGRAVFDAYFQVTKPGGGTEDVTPASVDASGNLAETEYVIDAAGDHEIRTVADGVVGLEHTEGWNINYTGGTTLQHSEGWENT